MSASTGVLREILSNSSIASLTPASLATASRCRTALVEPPVAITPAIALWRAFFVMIRRGRTPFLSRSITSRPVSKATSSLRGSTAGTPLNPMGDTPSISKAVEEMAADHQLDGVGDGLAADERGLHAFGAHGDPIGDADRVELDRRAAGGADPFLDLLGQLPVVPVTGRDLDPAVGDADQGALEVLVREADRLEVGPRGRAVGAVQEDPALVPGVESHADTSLCRLATCRLATRNVNLPCWTTSPC